MMDAKATMGTTSHMVDAKATMDGILSLEKALKQQLAKPLAQGTNGNPSAHEQQQH